MEFSLFFSPGNGFEFAAIPGLPLLGNLLQLTEKKPHRSFTTWAAKYGPIFSIQVGSVKQVVITSPEIAKEVL
jgi:ent-kaurene oxidase